MTIFFTESSVLEAIMLHACPHLDYPNYLFKLKHSKSSAATNLHAIPQNLFSAEGARDAPIWTVILQMLFQIFPLEFLTAILRARHKDKITLLQVILRKEEQFLKHWTLLNMNQNKLFHNTQKSPNFSQAIFLCHKHAHCMLMMKWSLHC